MPRVSPQHARALVPHPSLSPLSTRCTAPVGQRVCGVVHLAARSVEPTAGEQAERPHRLLQDLLRAQEPVGQRGDGRCNKEPGGARFRPGRSAEVDGLPPVDAGGDERRRRSEEHAG